MATYPQGFVPKRETTFFQHKARIAQLVKENMHDGKAWKPEAFVRYSELEDAEVLDFKPKAEPKQALQFVCQNCEVDVTIKITKDLITKSVICPICAEAVVVFDTFKHFQLI